jgi:excisionase family DNA binding protein
MEKLFPRAGSAEIPDANAIENEVSVARMLLTVEQAASLLGVGRTTMFALIRTGDVVTVQIGRLRRIRPADLAAYVDRLANVA